MLVAAWLVIDTARRSGVLVTCGGPALPLRYKLKSVCIGFTVCAAHAVGVDKRTVTHPHSHRHAHQVYAGLTLEPGD